MNHLNQLKTKSNKVFILLFLLCNWHNQIIQAQALPTGTNVRVDAFINQLKLSNFTYIKKGSFWECKITCTGYISYNGNKEVKNARVDYSYTFMSPNSGLQNNKKTISDRIKIAKIISGEDNSFIRVINFKIPIAANKTSYPDPLIYLCNDIITAKLSRVRGDTNPHNNTKTWKGENCIY